MQAVPLFRKELQIEKIKNYQYLDEPSLQIGEGFMNNTLIHRTSKFPHIMRN